jgi:hypothetical protein
VLPVKIIYNHATSARFETVVDTGSDYCLFHASIGASIGIKILSGPEGDLGGVISGTRSKVYYHNVKLVVGTDIVEIKAGFSWDLSENLLGQIGFFDNFIVTFDPSLHRPASKSRGFAATKNCAPTEKLWAAETRSATCHRTWNKAGACFWRRWGAD